MNQSKKDSFLEAIINIAIRAPINLTVNNYAFPSVMGHEITLYQNILIVFIFTMISLSISYSIRRFFNEKSIVEVLKCQLKLNQQTHGSQNALELQTIGLVRSAKQSMKKALKGFIVAIYFQGVIARLDGVRIMHKRYASVAINGLAVILLILVFG